MTGIQQSKRDMYLVVEKYLDTAPATIVAQMPNFTTLFTSFKEKVALTGAYTGSQELNRTGYADAKARAKEELVNSFCNVLN